MIKAVRVEFPKRKLQFYRLPDGKYIGFEDRKKVGLYANEVARVRLRDLMASEDNYRVGWVNINIEHWAYSALIRYWVPRGVGYPGGS